MYKGTDLLSDVGVGLEYYQSVLTLNEINDNIELVMNKFTTETNCPVCNKKRLLQMGNIVSSEEGSLVIYNQCPHCVSAFIAVISGSRDRGLVVVETLTDLTYQEATRMSRMTALTADAVLDVYQKCA